MPRVYRVVAIASTRGIFNDAGFGLRVVAAAVAVSVAVSVAVCVAVCVAPCCCARAYTHAVDVDEVTMCPLLTTENGTAATREYAPPHTGCDRYSPPHIISPQIESQIISRSPFFFFFF